MSFANAAKKIAQTVTGRRDVTFVTTFCRPDVTANGESCSLVYRAGSTHNVVVTDEIRELIERRYAHFADEARPLEPPVAGKPISSKLTDGAEDESTLTKVVDRLADVLEKRLAAKAGA